MMLTAVMLVQSLLACGTANTARPLPQGVRSHSLTLGGPIAEVGGSWIPLPNAVVESRVGLAPVAERATDVHVGWNLTALAFGIAGFHGGASHLLLDQNGWIPAVAATERLFLYGNHVDTKKEDPGLWALSETHLTASWDVGGHLVYAGLSEFLDFREPSLLLTPSLGTQIGTGRFRFQLEAQHMAANRVQPVHAITWLNPGRGAIAVTAGVSMQGSK
jgi:hypothetical protein